MTDFKQRPLTFADRLGAKSRVALPLARPARGCFVYIRDVKTCLE
jgi:hypothetical protein